ncbi:hypothetical protein G9A89_001043 [Geosiphon pyriformis]|nr:hypothetical protein G9A89_001043 [Geosiphon pyriformis]
MEIIDEKKEQVSVTNTNLTIDDLPASGNFTPATKEASAIVDVKTTKPLTLMKGFRNSVKSPGVTRKIILILSALVLINVAVWIASAFAFREYPTLMGTAALAYTLGLRHAVDADHLAAIDNVTRKLLQSGEQSVSVGFFFSLGHSTIVVIASIAIAATAAAIQDKLESFKVIGGIIGVSVSTLFLFLIGILNTFVFISIYRSFRRLQRTGNYEEEDINEILNKSGLLGRFFAPMYRFVDASWKMYPLGFLFGLGFDTSSEVGLLGISAFQANQGLSVWLILFFPLLFTSGMALIDTADGILMLGTYTWAYINPFRKLYYNLVITLLSILVAFVIGTIELLSILGDKLNLEGGFWDFFGKLGEGFGTIGYIIIGLFVFVLVFSMIYYRWAGYADLEKTLANRNQDNSDMTMEDVYSVEQSQSIDHCDEAINEKKDVP